MIAADDDGRLDRPRADELVEDEAHPGALAVAQPADAGGQPLEMDALARHAHPARQCFVLWEEAQDLLVGAIDVRRIA